jgi:putative FmdB family regulatory protein
MLRPEPYDMPIYEYDCPKCGRFDVLQKMSAAPLETHETCGSKVTKLMSAGSFAFKGSGFHQTDYKPAQGCERKSASSPACASCPSAQG